MRRTLKLAVRRAASLLVASLAIAALTRAEAVPPDPSRAVSTLAPRSFGDRLAAAALERTDHVVRYDGAYRRIAYPMGDVAPDRGVCTDVVVRAYRALGIDLQELVHRDMRRAFARYPRNWGLSRPDTNIDHRRVPNLETFFRRHGQAIPPSDDPSAYAPGDLVSYRLPGGLPHIAVVTGEIAHSGRPLVVHNIGAGPKLEDFLFSATIEGHFRFQPTGE